MAAERSRRRRRRRVGVRPPPTPPPRPRPRLRPVPPGGIAASRAGAPQPRRAAQAGGPGCPGAPQREPGPQQRPPPPRPRPLLIAHRSRRSPPGPPRRPPPAGGVAVARLNAAALSPRSRGGGGTERSGCQPGGGRWVSARGNGEEGRREVGVCRAPGAAPGPRGGAAVTAGAGTGRPGAAMAAGGARCPSVCEPRPFLGEREGERGGGGGRSAGRALRGLNIPHPFSFFLFKIIFKC